MAERLSFQTEATPYNSMIAAEHLSRYAVAAAFSKGKRVLDIACGEGYGSAFLADSGAAFVLGVDISAEAIASAQALFTRPTISYIVADALDENGWNPAKEKFDVIVCYETIEHLSAPEHLLRILKRSLSEQGTIIISCPNDHIDIKNGEHNIFHIRPYTLQEFQSLTTGILGAADQWLLGTPLTGISVLDAGCPLLSNQDQSIQRMNHSIKIKDTFLLPAQMGHNVEPKNSSYYLGIWNGETKPLLVGAPMSRQAYLDPWYAMLTAMKERDEVNRNVIKLEELVQLFEQRAETIRRISSFEFERLNEHYACLKRNIVNTELELNHFRAECNHYKSVIKSLSTSRAHRIAALYTRSATGKNSITKFCRFGKAALKAAIRAIGRKIDRSKTT